MHFWSSAFRELIRLIANGGIKREPRVVLPIDRAEEVFQAMREGRTRGTTVFTPQLSESAS